MKRRLFVRTALIAGCLGLMLGVAVLVRMSLHEYDDVLDQLAREREALHALARHDLEDVLHGALDRVDPQLVAARRAAFVARDNLYEKVGAVVAYPPPVRFGTSRWPTLIGLTAENPLPRCATPPCKDDWSGDSRERWRLATATPLDLEALLDHRARFRVPLELDLIATLVALERTGTGQAGLLSPDLAHAVLRDGLDRPDGHLEGLMGLALRARERLDFRDFEKVALRLVELSRRYLVRCDDFEREAARRDTPLRIAAETDQLGPGRRIVSWTAPAAAREGGASTREGETGDGPGAVEHEHEVGWAVEVTLEPERRVVAQRLPTDWLDGLAGRLAAADLIDIEADVSLASDGRSVDLVSPRWTAQAEDAKRRLWLKGIPAAAIALLGLAVTVMAFTLQRRREAYIRLRSSLLAAVTHELKTPLASIRAMAETLEMRLEGDTRARDYPRRIVRSSERLAFLVDNVLSFARLDRESWTLKRTLVPLSDLVSRVKDRAEAMAPAGERLGHLKPAEFVVDDADLVLEVDPELVQLLLANLVDNAMRYAVAPTVRLEIRGRFDPQSTIITVADDGPGLNHKAQVGDDLSSSPAVGGTGLGLSLCRLIMELHRGTMRLLDTTSSGTTFELRFPLPGTARDRKKDSSSV